MALFGETVTGNKGVGFGEIGGGVAFGEVVGDGEEVGGGAGLAVEVTGDIDGLFSYNALCLHVFQVEEDDPAFVVNASVAIIESVDGGVELVVTAEGLEEELTGLGFHGGKVGGEEVGFLIVGIELSLFDGVG